MFIVAICAIAWRSPDILSAIGFASAAQDPSAISIDALAVQTPQTPGKQPMTTTEFAELSKTDPAAYQKFLSSYQVEEGRSEVDKLFNFLARGKYE